MNLIRIVVLFSITAITSFSCGNSMMLHESLERNTTYMEVKGRSGGLAGQKLYFGNYYSNKVTRKMFSGQQSAYAVSSLSITDTIIFELYDSMGHSASVIYQSYNSNLELPVIGEKYKIPIGGKNYCSGTIRLNFDNDDNWGLVLNNPDITSPANLSEGAISNGEVNIEIKGVNKNMQRRLTQDRILGYEFWIGNRIIGAVELTGKGKVWIKEALPNTVKFLVASAAAAMLFRYDISKAALIE